VDVAERAQSVRTAVAGLEMAERTALELAYFSDLSQSQIAERLGIPLGTVKTRIRGAMIKLREALSGRQA
jgi:RNA polymerase sigma-70 factor (ECF subfamily)